MQEGEVLDNRACLAAPADPIGHTEHATAKARRRGAIWPSTSFPPLFPFLFLQSSDPLVRLTSQGPMQGANMTLQDTLGCSSF